MSFSAPSPIDLGAIGPSNLSHIFRKPGDPPPEPGDRALCGAIKVSLSRRCFPPGDPSACVVCLDLWDSGIRP